MFSLTTMNGAYGIDSVLVLLDHKHYIARNQGHFEPADNYQRYIVLHSGTIEYQENSIWRRSRLDLQRRVKRRPSRKSLEFFESER